MKSESDLVADVRQRLLKRFTAVPSERVAAEVLIAHTRFEHSTVRDFVPLLIERRVTDELARLA